MVYGNRLTDEHVLLAAIDGFIALSAGERSRTFPDRGRERQLSRRHHHPRMPRGLRAGCSPSCRHGSETCFA